ncbi:Predicted AAA-ATPase [Caldicoprobacter faecalis]|uniref:Predicted AAA-ATPase n=1 Tax=Caldicoprobacter faecalis TaxID=937334 RepID=A0A1I5WJ38_9FIRM|nr:Predicted AAA-ATPase [Caldicoprobacter faecalis]
MTVLLDTNISLDFLLYRQPFFEAVNKILIMVRDMMEMIAMKKIPYGISNFKAMREEGYLYVDKTMYIEKIENMSDKYLFFIRPRRFGKSLFLRLSIIMI